LPTQAERAHNTNQNDEDAVRSDASGIGREKDGCCSIIVNPTLKGVTTNINNF
jgi:hypothetical protein